jgi:hypothetical protein
MKNDPTGRDEHLDPSDHAAEQREEPACGLPGGEDCPASGGSE